MLGGSHHEGNIPTGYQTPPLALRFSNFLFFKEPELEILYKLKELVCTMMDLTQRGLIIITSQNLSLEKF